MTRPKTAKIDDHVRALLELGVRDLVLDHDADYDVYVLPALITDGEEEEGVTYPYVEYQVSNGLAGRRSHSADCSTYAEAKKEFEEMLDEAKKNRAPNPPFWRET